ncbi:MAG: tRNA-intron lyase [Candidatus Pacearchaeota archaeon]
MIKEAKKRKNRNKEKKEKRKIKSVEKKKKTFKAFLAGERVFSTAKEAFDLYNRSHFGEPIEKKIYYSLVEALYLLDMKKIAIYEGKKKLSHDAFIERAQKLEQNFWTRYCVFRDIRSRGYIVKTALKFGADFRVYDRGVKPGKEHAKWIVYPVFETNTLTWHEFAAKSRVAHSTRKNLLIAIVDDEGDVTYYQVSWIRP